VERAIALVAQQEQPQPDAVSQEADTPPAPANMGDGRAVEPSAANLTKTQHD